MVLQASRNPVGRGGISSRAPVRVGRPHNLRGLTSTRDLPALWRSAPGNDGVSVPGRWRRRVETSVRVARRCAGDDGATTPPVGGADLAQGSDRRSRYGAAWKEFEDTDDADHYPDRTEIVVRGTLSRSRRACVSQPRSAMALECRRDAHQCVTAPVAGTVGVGFAGGRRTLKSPTLELLVSIRQERSQLADPDAERRPPGEYRCAASAWLRTRHRRAG